MHVFILQDISEFGMKERRDFASSLHAIFLPHLFNIKYFCLSTKQNQYKINLPITYHDKYIHINPCSFRRLYMAVLYTAVPSTAAPCLLVAVHLAERRPLPPQTSSVPSPTSS